KVFCKAASSPRKLVKTCAKAVSKIARSRKNNPNLFARPGSKSASQQVGTTSSVKVGLQSPAAEPENSHEVHTVVDGTCSRAASDSVISDEAQGRHILSNCEGDGISEAIQDEVGSLPQNVGAEQEHCDPDDEGTQDDADTTELDENLQEELDRRCFGYVRDIPLNSIRDQAVQHIIERYSGRYPRCAHAAFLDEGTFNRVYVIQFYEELDEGELGEMLGKFCFKIPRIADPTRWTEADSKCLRSTALAMRYIKRNTGTPMADVIAYDSGHDNDIKVPYILETFIEGEPLSKLWWCEENDATVSLHQKRKQILESLATCMAQLKNLPFLSVGRLAFDGEANDNEVPRIQSWYRETTHDPWEDDYDEDEEIPVVDTTLDYYEPGLGDNVLYMNSSVFTKGVRYMTHLALKHIPACKRTPPSAAKGVSHEIFGFKHPDLDKQNVFVDKLGNVTGIIDWDGVRTGPSWLSWAGLPMWLCEDFEADYVWPAEYKHSPEEMDLWRDYY
ncbi:hypothetical protein LTS18_008383, partial [Coniosporium uncinatum]